MIAEELMTEDPITVPVTAKLRDAAYILQTMEIRHLPVVDGGRLVGLVSQRDLYLTETLAGVDPATEMVREAMSDEPYTVAPDARLEEHWMSREDIAHWTAAIDKGGR